jgi:hypothetical protein
VRNIHDHHRYIGEKHLVGGGPQARL